MQEYEDSNHEGKNCVCKAREFKGEAIGWGREYVQVVIPYKVIRLGRTS